MSIIDAAGLLLGLITSALAGWAVHEARAARMASQSSARAAGRASLRAEDASKGRPPDYRLTIPDPLDNAPTERIPLTLGALLEAEGLDMTTDPETGRVRVYSKTGERNDGEVPPS